MSSKSLIPALFLALLTACGGPSAEEIQNEAQGLLAAGKAAEAITKADEALADASIKGDPALAWRFESIRLDASASMGKAEDVVPALERLGATYGKQITPAMYRSLADKLVGAKNTQGAIDLLVAGDKKFPEEHASFDEAITKLKSAGSMDPETIKKLEALGYLGGGADEAAPTPSTPPAGEAAPAGGTPPAAPPPAAAPTTPGT